MNVIVFNLNHFSGGMSDAQPTDEKPKSASQLRKEAEKAKKLEKFQKKQEQLKAAAAAKPKEVTFFV